jgi:hypothetical protein
VQIILGKTGYAWFYPHAAQTSVRLIFLPDGYMSPNTRMKDSPIEQLPQLFLAARLVQAAATSGRVKTATLPSVQLELVKVLREILDQPLQLPDLPNGNRVSYLRQLIEAYYCLFQGCLESISQNQLMHQSLVKTVQRLTQIPDPIIQEEYDRLNRNNYNQALKQLVLSFSRPALAQRSSLPLLTEPECLLALFVQAFRQQLGAVVLLGDRFRTEYRDLLRSVCIVAQDPDLCQTNVISWLWEAMKSFDPLKAFGATGHGRPTFEAWVRTVVNNKLADEKRKLLKREADELLFYEPKAVQMFQERYAALPSHVQPELDLPACLRLIRIVQTEITDPKIRASTSRLRQRMAQLLNWSIIETREIHQQVRRILGRYVQSTRSLNISSTDSNQEWIDNFPDARTLPNLALQELECIIEFLQGEETPNWVKDWCEKRRTQAEIARELFVSQPTISRCLGREYRLWLYRKFFTDAQTPAWMKRWYDTQSVTSPHRRRQLRREIHSEYSQNLCSAKEIDDQIEIHLADWCTRNEIYYLP